MKVEWQKKFDIEFYLKENVPTKKVLFYLLFLVGLFFLEYFFNTNRISNKVPC